MAVEIERKFLVSGDFRGEATQSGRIVQGYLCANAQRTVRVRIRGEQGFLTIKGASDEKGLSRYEFEKPISLEEAEQLLLLCEPGVIDKVRHLIPVGSHTWEVDVFAGENEGLVVAEIELASEAEPFDKPTWLGCEVTGDRRYYNALLATHPYGQWAAHEKQV